MIHRSKQKLETGIDMMPPNHFEMRVRDSVEVVVHKELFLMEISSYGNESEPRKESVTAIL